MGTGKLPQVLPLGYAGGGYCTPPAEAGKLWLWSGKMSELGLEYVGAAE